MQKSRLATLILLLISIAPRISVGSIHLNDTAMNEPSGSRVKPARLVALQEATQSSIPTSPAILISQWADAIGGLARVAQVKVIYREEQSNEDGLLGIRQKWSTSDLRDRENIDHAQDQSQVVLNRDHAWLHDWNGKTQTLHGDDLKLQVSLAILHSFAALQGQAGIATFLGSDPATKAHIVQFHPENGYPITIYLDSASHLPIKAEVPGFDGNEAITFSDWREVDGIKIPFSEKQQDPIKSTELKLRKVVFNPNEEVSFAEPPSSEHDAFFVMDPSKAGVMFNFENRHILVPVTVNGVGPIYFIFDTGSNYNYINNTRLEQFHVKAYGAFQTEGGANTTQGAYIQSINLRIGGVELRGQHAGTLPMSGLEKVMGVPLGGLLGYDFISRFVVIVDYTHNRLEFEDPKTFHYQGAGAAIPLLMQSSEPYLEQSITEKGQRIPALFVLDAGAADTFNLTSGFVKTHNLVELAGDPNAKPKTRPGTEKEFFGATMVRGFIDEVHLGPFTFYRVIGGLSVGTHGAYASNAFSGTIGQGIYSRFNRMVLDYARDRVIFEPGPKLNEPFHERRSFGLSILAEGSDLKTFRVAGVTPGSPAEKAGFNKSDIISAVDSQSANDLSIAKLDEILQQEGVHRDFTVRRGDVEIKIPATITTVPISGLT